MPASKGIGRRKLLSLFADDLKFLGSALIPQAAVNLAESGIAKIQKEQCLAFWGQICTACHHACPANPKAIELKDFRYPVIQADFCDGCGKCIQACLAPNPAITVPASPFDIGRIDDSNGK